MLVTTSHEIVVRARATSRALIRSPPCSPIRTNSSSIVIGEPGHVGHVGHHGVHRDRPHERHADPPDERLGAVRRGPRPAVAVADRQRRDPARPVGREGRAVADPAALASSITRIGRACSDRIGWSSAAAPSRSASAGRSSGGRPYRARPSRTPSNSGPVPARRPPLALRWRRGIRTPSAPSRSSTASNRLAWPEVRSRSAGAWRWDQMPPSRTPGAAAIRAADGSACVGSDPRPAQAGLDLEVQLELVGRMPPAAGPGRAAGTFDRGQGALEQGGVANRDRDPAPAGPAACSGGIANRTRIGRPRPASRSSTASSKVAMRQAVGGPAPRRGGRKPAPASRA